MACLPVALFFTDAWPWAPSRSCPAFQPGRCSRPSRIARSSSASPRHRTLSARSTKGWCLQPRHCVRRAIRDCLCPFRVRCSILAVLYEHHAPVHEEHGRESEHLDRLPCRSALHRRLAVNCSNFSRENFFRTITSPAALTPTRWNTDLPRSIPTVRISMNGLLSLQSSPSGLAADHSIKLIWIWLSPRSFIISGAVREIQTRSRYVRLAKSTAKTKIR
jgi:hypothetical protein